MSTKCLRGEDFATFKGQLGLESHGREGGGIGIVEVGLCQAPMSLVSAEEDKLRRPVFSLELERQAKLNQPTLRSFLRAGICDWRMERNR